MEIRFQLLNYAQAVQTLYDKRNFHASKKIVDEIYNSTKKDWL
jgi:hypothetical protein